MAKESLEFSNLFSREGQDLETRKEILERSDKMKEKFDENYHTKGRPEWLTNLYLELDHFIMGLGQIRKEYLESYIKYSHNGLLFAYILLRRENLRLWAKVSYDSLDSKPLFVKDYEPVSRRIGVMIIFDDKREFVQAKEAMFSVTHNIIKRALRGLADRKRVKTPLKPVTEVEPIKLIEKIKPISIDISVNNNGDMNINLKLKKEQRGILERILQETIFK